MSLPNDVAGLMHSVDALISAEVLYQKGIAVWLTGLSGAGKSTIATLLEKKLAEENYFSVTLDGDVLRNTINKDLGFSTADRAENIRRAAEIAKMLVQKNIVAICSFISPLQKHRDVAAGILGEHYFEVFVDCPLPICEQRDVKGLYSMARKNIISDFTGIGSDFEPPQYARYTLHTNQLSAEACAALLFEKLLPYIQPSDI